MVRIDVVKQIYINLFRTIAHLQVIAADPKTTDDLLMCVGNARTANTDLLLALEEDPAYRPFLNTWREEAVRLGRRERAVQESERETAPKAPEPKVPAVVKRALAEETAGTNITDDARGQFQAILDRGENAALVSCFYDGEPTSCIARISRIEDGGFLVSPIAVMLTEDMKGKLLDHDGNAPSYLVSPRAD